MAPLCLAWSCWLWNARLMGGKDLGQQDKFWYLFCWELLSRLVINHSNRQTWCSTIPLCLCLLTPWYNSWELTNSSTRFSFYALTVDWIHVCWLLALWMKFLWMCLKLCVEKWPRASPWEEQEVLMHPRILWLFWKKQQLGAKICLWTCSTFSPRILFVWNLLLW